MYQPAHFREDRPEVLQALIRTHPLACLVTLNAGALVANHVPLLWEPEPGPKGVLRGHIARANTQWRDLHPDVESLAIFQGPAAYITPSWYPAKQETGRVVPTYNYAVVHAHGPITVIEDAEWLGRQVRALTEQQEVAFARPWMVDDAPAEFIAGQIRAIVGIEMQITRLEGKWKASQNRSDADQAGVVAGLRSLGDTEAAAMAALVERKVDRG